MMDRDATRIIIIKRGPPETHPPASSVPPSEAPPSRPDALQDQPPPATHDRVVWSEAQRTGLAVTGGLLVAVLTATGAAKLAEMLDPARHASPMHDRALPTKMERQDVTSVAASMPAPVASEAVHPALSAETPKPIVRAPPSPRVLPKFPDAFRGEVRVREQTIAGPDRAPPVREAAPIELDHAAVMPHEESPRSAIEAFYASVPAIPESGDRRVPVQSEGQSDPPALPLPLGLRYTIEPAATRGAASQDRVTIESNQDAYAYIWRRYSDGAWHRSFPPRHADHEAARVERGKRYAFFTTSDEREALGEPPMVIVLSRAPAPETVVLSRHDESGIDTEGRFQDARPPLHLREETDELTANGSSVKAVYIVELAPHPSSFLQIAAQ